MVGPTGRPCSRMRHDVARRLRTAGHGPSVVASTHQAGPALRHKYKRAT